MIKHIIFDLGNVLVHLHPERAFSAFARDCGAPAEKLGEFFLSPLHNDFMAGKIAPLALFQKLNSLYACDITFQRFTENWNGIIGDLKQGIPQLFEALSGRYRLGICSNVDPLHWEYCMNSFPTLYLAQDYFLSFQMGVNKPDRNIFFQMLAMLGAQPEQCLFIDDIGENIRVADALGVETIHASEPREIHEKLFEKKLISGRSLVL